MNNILQITPFMYADDLEEAVRFFRDLLGFTATVHESGYAYLEREGAAVLLMQNSPECTLPRSPGRPFRYNMDVRDSERPSRRTQAKAGRIARRSRLRTGRPKLRSARTDDSRTRPAASLFSDKRSSPQRLDPPAPIGYPELAAVRQCAPVAQLDRATGYEPVGRRFDSFRAHHLPPHISSPS